MSLTNDQIKAKIAKLTKELMDDNPKILPKEVLKAKKEQLSLLKKLISTKKGGKKNNKKKLKHGKSKHQTGVPNSHESLFERKGTDKKIARMKMSQEDWERRQAGRQAFNPRHQPMMGGMSQQQQQQQNALSGQLMKHGSNYDVADNVVKGLKENSDKKFDEMNKNLDALRFLPPLDANGDRVVNEEKVQEHYNEVMDRLRDTHTNVRAMHKILRGEVDFNPANFNEENVEDFNASRFYEGDANEFEDPNYPDYEHEFDNESEEEEEGGEGVGELYEHHINFGSARVNFLDPNHRYKPLEFPSILGVSLEQEPSQRENEIVDDSLVRVQPYAEQIDSRIVMPVPNTTLEISDEERMERNRQFLNPSHPDDGVEIENDTYMPTDAEYFDAVDAERAGDENAFANLINKNVVGTTEVEENVDALENELTLTPKKRSFSSKEGFEYDADGKRVVHVNKNTVPFVISDGRALVLDDDDQSKMYIISGNSFRENPSRHNDVVPATPATNLERKKINDELTIGNIIFDRDIAPYDNLLNRTIQSNQEISKDFLRGAIGNRNENLQKMREMKKAREEEAKIALQVREEAKNALQVREEEEAEKELDKVLRDNGSEDDESGPKRKSDKTPKKSSSNIKMKQEKKEEVVPPSVPPSTIKKNKEEVGVPPSTIKKKVMGENINEITVPKEKEKNYYKNQVLKMFDMKETTLSKQLYAMCESRGINIGDSPKDLYYKLLIYEGTLPRESYQFGKKIQIDLPNGTSMPVNTDKKKYRINFL